MPFTEIVQEIKLLARSRYGLVVLETLEDERAETLLKLLSSEENLPFFVWNLSRGLHRVDAPDRRPLRPEPDAASKPKEGIYGSAKLETALDHLVTAEQPALYFFQGLEPFLQEPLVQAKLLEAARHFAKTDSSLFLTGHDLLLPPALQPHTAILRLPEPKPQEFRDLIGRIYRDLNRGGNIAFELTGEEMERFLQSLKGLSLLEAEKILTKAMLEDGKLGLADLERVMAAKKQIIEREGVLEYYPSEYTLQDVAGMHALKGWLAKRQQIFAQPEKARQFGLSFPKGMLLLGVPGSGKSLSAKAVASEWRLPLLKMDTASLYNKYVGETERNFKRATRAAERVAPVVLWIDEIEKAFAQGGEQDGGVAQRVLGSFLSWMQDRKGDVFVVATANNVHKLPPEFLRKGRFDEIFFVDLPDAEARKRILEIHIARHGHDPGRIDLEALAAVSEGFSGSELEQIIVSALYTAFAEGGQLTTKLLMNEALATKPLSVTRAEEIRAMRAWALERAVSAN